LEGRRDHHQIIEGGEQMATYFMFGKYTAEAVRDMSIERTQQVVEEIKSLGGDVQAMHAVMGEYDLVFCVQLPDVESALKASVKLTQLTGISFMTAPAVSVEHFDRMMGA
jgi:uncharacterized protein with GYD domain